MSRSFASYLAEDMPLYEELTGAYDPEQQLWIGDLPLAANITGPGDAGGGTGSTQKTVGVTQTGPSIDDLYFAQDPDAD